ncbi:hypothetical protein ACTS94_02730 [Empedobacter falsenii]
MFKFQCIFLFFICTFVNSQNNKSISKEIDFLSKKKDKGAEDSFLIGKEMLRISRNDCEKMKSYLRMGDAKCKSMQYSESIQYLKKANDLANGCNFINDHFNINFFLLLNYQELDLNTEANETWNKLLKISKKIQDPSIQFSMMQARALYFEKRRDYSNAVIYRKMISDFVEKLLKSNYPDTNRFELGLAYIQLSYVYLKDNKLKDAKFYFDQVPALVEGVPKEDHYLLDLEYLVKGMIYAENGQTKEAKKWFDESLYLANKRKYPATIAKISEEKLHYGIDSKAERQKNLDVIKQTNQGKLNESGKYYTAEFEKNEKDNLLINNKFSKLIIFTFLLLILIVFLLIAHRRSKKKIEERFENIILTLQNKTEEKDIDIQQEIIKKGTSQMSRIMSIKTEKELLVKLQLFEKGTAYTSKNFTFSNFISILETNSKYANYIIKEYRQKNFNDYLNDLRIKYIVEKLYNNPEYLNYKISYLADISGFSTHSRFTQIFKKVVKISPSQFIHELSNKHKLN